MSHAVRAMKSGRVVAQLCLGIIVLLASLNARADGVQRVSTVERGKAATPCVIDLSPPKEKGHCELAPDDPPARVDMDSPPLPATGHGSSMMFDVWYEPQRFIDDPGVYRLIGNGADADLYRIDNLAHAILIASSQPDYFALKFFQAKPVKLPAELNPSAGETVRWQSKSPVFRVDELRKQKKELIKWARLWVRARGGKFPSGYRKELKRKGLL